MSGGDGVTVIGFDGGPLGERAAAALAGATLVVGGARHLAGVGVPQGARTIRLGALGSALEVLRAHAANPDGRAVVLASGDPGFFGIVRRLRAEGLEVARVIPAVSSVSAAFAAARLDWDDAAVVSAHGRDPRHAVNACLAHGKVAVLTGPDAGARELAARLLAAGLAARDREVYVAEQLGTAQERVRLFDLAEAADLDAADVRDPNVVLCVAPGPERESAGWLAGAGRPGTPGPLPDDAFEFRDGQITKQETRALVLARLAPRFGDLVWDLGAGSGSVGIECARRGAAVFAVEKDPDSGDRLRRNAAAHSRTGLYICIGDAVEAAARLPEPDAVFVGGGGLPVLQAVTMERAVPRVVAAYASFEHAGEALALLARHGYAADGLMHQASRIAGLPDGTHRLSALNPVFLVWGERQ